MENIISLMMYIKRTGKIIKLLDTAKKLTLISGILVATCFAGKTVYDCRKICCKG